MKAALYKNSRVVEVEEIKKPKIKDNEALIKVKYTGICGTDLHIYEGLHPRAKAPLVMGHEISGIVDEIRTNRKDMKVGERVVINPLISCGNCFPCKENNPHLCPNLNLVGIDQNGGFAEYVKVRDDKLYKIPNSLSMDLAALMEPVAVAVHAVRKSQLSLGDKVAVIGGGPIGQLIAQICKLNGASSVVMLEINPERVSFAKKFGIITGTSLEESIRKVKEATRGKGADIVYEAVGIQETYDYTTGLVKVGGKIVAVGAASKPIALNFWKIYFEELKIIGIHVYEPEDIEISIDFLNRYPKIFQIFMSKIIELKNLGGELKDMANGATESIKVLVGV
ncbi:putative zinc-type alcohol dehydrogenase-like protein YjmD [subsurface metagenome]|jgi:2-desacetyl-2-hydroxyethyl bacteriochlorophyllide A dehydrogenase